MRSNIHAGGKRPKRPTCPSSLAAVHLRGWVKDAPNQTRMGNKEKVVHLEFECTHFVFTGNNYW